MKIDEIITHGEVTVFVSKIPASLLKKTLKKKKPNRGQTMIVANSENTGNHHIVDVIDGVDFYEDETGKLFMENSVETNIRCVQAERHSAIPLPPVESDTMYEFAPQLEYDPFAARLVASRD